MHELRHQESQPIAAPARVHDAQCGFKALRADVAHQLLPLVEDDGWFFDTELLLLAEHNDLRIHEVPVDWIDDPDSRVDVTRTAIDDLRGTVRMLRRFAAGYGSVELAPREHVETRNAFVHRLATRTSMATAWSAARIARLALGARPR